MDSEAYLEKLRAMAPKREAFKTQEEFEEAQGYWRGHQGRILAAHDRQVKDRSKDSTALPK